MTSPAHAAYVIDFHEVGTSVVSTGSGTLDTACLMFEQNYAPGTPYVIPNYGTTFVGSNLSVSTSSIFGFTSGPNLFGTGNVTLATAVSGLPVGVDAINKLIFVPLGYISGHDLGVSTATYAFNNFASLGLTTGSYVWTWGRGDSADSFTVNISNAVAAVPEPATWAQMLLGLGVIGAGLRLQPRKRVKFNFA